ncbi:MAG: S-layer homology domain-containing protein [Clostridia bacterium]|nr:S-layer homology domain-containing protein [Clostridia bacterium]
MADWAREALSDLVEASIITGSNNKLNPASSATRAEITQVLYNLLFK